MNIDTIYGSKYIKSSELQKPVVLTIKAVRIETFTRQDQEPLQKPVLSFDEIDKEFVCNKTNALKVADICQSKDTESWTGHRVMLLPDKTTFQGKLVQTISVSAPI